LGRPHTRRAHHTACSHDTIPGDPHTHSVAHIYTGTPAHIRTVTTHTGLRMHARSTHTRTYQHQYCLRTYTRTCVCTHARASVHATHTPTSKCGIAHTCPGSHAQLHMHSRIHIHEVGLSRCHGCTGTYGGHMRGTRSGRRTGAVLDKQAKTTNRRSLSRSMPHSPMWKQGGRAVRRRTPGWGHRVARYSGRALRSSPASLCSASIAPPGWIGGGVPVR
jgi:hypothetical protein